ncbi:MAG: YaiO family outer membrane beta-barrel protein [Brevundimonas sp.]|uniref:YaiO family outer membrane beta-barrel protein n=1 Tax=Brevundimonas sp. TaxID=1871086 RepID=UPI00391DD855
MLPVLAVPVEVAAQVQTDPQALYEAAVADRLAGRPARAVERLERVLVLRPADVDARLNLGLALLALDRVAEAEAAFRTVLDQAPGYVDAEVGLARAAERRGDRAAARRHAERAAALSPEREDVAGLNRALADIPWRIDIGAARSRLSGGLPDWTESRIGVSRTLTGGWAVGGAVERTERFGRTDVYAEARLDRRRGQGDIYVAVGGTPDADYRPEVVVLAGGSLPVGPGLRATLDGSAARYPSGSVESLTASLTAALLADRLELGVRWINVRDERDEHRAGYAVQATWRVTDRFRLSAGRADAPEATEGVVTEVVATNLGAAWDLTDRVTLRLGVVDEDRGAYGRDELSLALGWRF